MRTSNDGPRESAYIPIWTSAGLFAEMSQAIISELGLGHYARETAENPVISIEHQLHTSCPWPISLLVSKAAFDRRRRSYHGGGRGDEFGQMPDDS